MIYQNWRSYLPGYTSEDRASAFFFKGTRDNSNHFRLLHWTDANLTNQTGAYLRAAEDMFTLMIPRAGIKRVGAPSAQPEFADVDGDGLIGTVLL